MIHKILFVFTFCTSNDIYVAKPKGVFCFSETDDILN